MFFFVKKNALPRHKTFGSVVRCQKCIDWSEICAVGYNCFHPPPLQLVFPDFLILSKKVATGPLAEPPFFANHPGRWNTSLWWWWWWWSWVQLTMTRMMRHNPRRVTQIYKNSTNTKRQRWSLGALWRKTMLAGCPWPPGLLEDKTPSLARWTKFQSFLCKQKLIE